MTVLVCKCFQIKTSPGPGDRNVNYSPQLVCCMRSNHVCRESDSRKKHLHPIFPMKRCTSHTRFEKPTGDRKHVALLFKSPPLKLFLLVKFMQVFLLNKTKLHLIFCA